MESVSQAKPNFIPIDFFKRAWRLFKEKWEDVYKVLGLVFFLQLVATTVASYNQENMSDLTNLFVGLALQAFTLILNMNLIRLMLKIIRGQSYELSELFDLDHRFLAYIWGLFKVGLIAAFGFLLLIVPGVIWALKYSMVQYLIIDKKIDSREALTLSAKMTKGVKGKLFWIMLLGFGINLLGLIALVLGLFITIPVTYIANLLVYQYLLEKVRADAVGAKDKKSSSAPQD